MSDSGDQIDGLEFATIIEPQATPKRDEQIRDAIIAGHAPKIVWVPIEVSHGGHTGTLFCAARVFRVGDVNPLICNVSHVTAQQLVDHVRDDGTMSPEPCYGAVLGTARMSDLCWLEADKHLPGCTQPSAGSDRIAKGYSPRMDDTPAMVRHHQEVTAARGDLGDDVLAAPEGKDWYATSRLVGHADRSAEYGLQVAGATFAGVTPGVRVAQPAPGMAHGAHYKDYIMCPRAWRARMIADGAWCAVAAVARDPELCWLVSSEGIIRSLRHPAVPLPDASPDTARQPMPLFHRYLKLMRPMMVGDDVAVWQRVIHAKADGVFGPQTHTLTVSWQRKHGLEPDGIVGHKTIAAAQKYLGVLMLDFEDVPAGTVAARPSLAAVPFVQAVHYTRANRAPGDIRLGLVHTMEAPEKPTTAESVADWFAGRLGPAPQASAHACVDNDSVVECVHLRDVAWGAKSGNRDGYHIEHAGYARQTAEEWADPYSMSMLALSAAWARRTLVDSPVKLPVVKLSVDQVRDGKSRGFAGHRDVTDAFHVAGGHQDPGSFFPYDTWFGMMEDGP